MQLRNLIVVVGVLVVTGHADAQVKEWNNPQGGLYDDPSNWTPEGVPHWWDDVRFNLGATYVVLMGPVGTADVMAVQDDVTFDLLGGAQSLGNPTSFLGDVVLRNGDFGSVDTLYLSHDDMMPEPPPVVDLPPNESRSGAVMLEDATLVVGHIAAGDSFPDFEWLDRAGGLVEVRAGGQLESTTVSFQGSSSGPARMRIIDGGEWSNTGEMSIRLMAEATVASGGQVIAGLTRIEGTDAIVSGAGSVWVTGPVYLSGWDVDYPLDQSLMISDGGAVISSNVGFGDFVHDVYDTSIAEATVTGAGSSWTITGHLGMGWGGSHLRVLGGATLATGSATLSGGSSGDHTITVVLSGDGSTWTNDGALSVGDGDGWYDYHQNVRLEVRDGGRIVSETMTIINDPDEDWGHNARLLGNGTIEAFVSNAGQIWPGTDGTPGGLTIEGDYAQAANGELFLGVWSEDQYGHLSITGTASLDGLLDVTIAGGPEPGDRFTLLDAAQIDGEFATIDLPPPGDETWHVVYRPDAVELRIGPVPGDASGDGLVDVEDLLMVLAVYDTSCPPDPEPCPADVDGNGSVGIGDLLLVLAEWE